MEQILLPVIAVGGMGLIFGVLLAIAAKIFAVKKDERIPLITELLPGANCGGCGFAGCAACAEAIATGKASASACPVASSEVAEKIAEIVGVEVVEEERMTAYVLCSGNKAVAEDRYINNNDIDCHTANRLAGGMKACLYGCLGLGSCVAKCNFGALSIKNGVAVVDREKCVNCGLCIAECPRNIIKRIPYDARVINVCSSKSAGKITRQVCGVGCIGCGICAKSCESGAISIENNLAIIDHSKCTSCGVCAEKCPRKIIKFYDKKQEPVPEIQVAKKSN